VPWPDGPAFAPRASASAATAKYPVLQMLFTSFMAAPIPRGPRWTIVRASTRRTGRHASRTALSPPTMSVRAPCSAPVTPPVTGASSMPTPRAAAAAPTARTVSGSTVLMSMRTLPSLAPSRIPPGASATSRRAAGSATMVITMRLAAATSAGRRPTRTAPPAAAANSSALLPVRL
jgi:hypothetical protein